MSEALNEIVKKALELKDMGLSTSDVARELNLSGETALWLTLKPPKKMKKTDLYIDISGLVGQPQRLGTLASSLADLIREQIGREFGDMVVMNSSEDDTPASLSVARELELDFVLMKTLKTEKGEEIRYPSTGYPEISGREAIIIQNVISSGKGAELCIKRIEEEGGSPRGVFCVVNKSDRQEIDNVRVHPLIKVIKIGP
ncbi:MAG: orotate phosphoribosyltransferase-like protein [Nitrososphaeria archaeon]|nr:orotate phosphoribosyltransferase-like protein [Nitrososphaeria archaeon]NIN53272.1 orotate phosphoribosyltransferase-like protein [Nitrososphaeria archaeon]NIQ33723.1 orotate phosphoribosyltransferase-like protein [Nitrososphaeria archaeon]